MGRNAYQGQLSFGDQLPAAPLPQNGEFSVAAARKALECFQEAFIGDGPSAPAQRSAGAACTNSRRTYTCITAGHRVSERAMCSGCFVPAPVVGVDD